MTDKAPAVRPGKAVVQRHDLELLLALAPSEGLGDFQGAFYAFPAAIGEKHTVESGEFGQARSQRRLVAVVVEVRAVNQAAHLLANGLEDSRVAVAERIHAYAGDEVQVALAGLVVHIAALPSDDDQGKTAIALDQTLFL